MDSDGAAERVWLEAIGQLDAERVAHGAGIGVLAGALWRGDGVSVASWGFARGDGLDATVRTRRLCHR